MLFKLESTAVKLSINVDYLTGSESECSFDRLANINAPIKKTLDHVNLESKLSGEDTSVSDGTNNTELATI